MEEQLPNYCEHFEYLKISESLAVEKEAACKYCFESRGLWICLAKNCGISICSKNSLEHLRSHLDESRRNKKFHSIFMNPGTAEIRCVQCEIEIGDLDIPSNANVKSKHDPFHFRVKMLPGLAQLTSHKIVGQLQNSEGHRKISRGLVGLFATKYNHTINTAIQFIAHSKFLNELLLQLKISLNNKSLRALREVLVAIDKAEFRAIHTDVLTFLSSQQVCELLFKEFPHLLGYQRKDPFEVILYFFNLINEETLHYSLISEPPYQDTDQWDLFYKRSLLRSHHLIYSAIEATLSLNYSCHKCNKSLSVPHNIQFLKLNIPKKRRKVKQVEKELASHRYDSPVKNRRKSLMNLFKDEECPITVPELIIELMKSPLHKDLSCPDCSQSLRKTKLHFQKLPDILIIQIARISKDKSILDQTSVELSTDSIDLGSFTSHPEEEVWYDFESAVCIEKGCLFPVVVVGQFNKQRYVIRNEIVQLSKEKMNPYILCFKKRASATAKQKLTEIEDDLKSEGEKPFQLPDFWYLQLQNGIERTFKNQMVCKHSFLKPRIESKMLTPVKVSSFVYEDLHHFYKNYQSEPLVPDMKKKSMSSEGSPKVSSRLSVYQQRGGAYTPEVCEVCGEQWQMLNSRRKREREYVLMFDRLKGQSIPYCMISSSWIKKWSSFLYSRETYAYMPKGYPLPLSIDNKVLLEGHKCKTNLVKNQDFKVLNIYLWKFLKQLYGGGPEIRYKWKEGRDNLDEDMLADIRNKVTDLKMLFSSSYLQSPKKMINSLSYIQKSSIMDQANESFIRPQPIEIEELEEDEA